MGKKVTTEIFISMAQEKHGDKYDYSQEDAVHRIRQVLL